MMNKKTTKMMILALTIAAAVSFTACGSDKKSTESNVENTSPKSEAPAASEPEEETSKDGSQLFSKMDTVDINGEKVDSDVFAKNKVTLVNLWNVGCSPCVGELPILDELNKEYEGKGAAIKGLYFSASSKLSDQELADINDILEKADASYQQLTLSEDMLNNDIIQNIQAYPTTFVVDSNGNIIDKIEGSNDYDGWKAFIEDQLAKVSENA